MTELTILVRTILAVSTHCFPSTLDDPVKLVLVFADRHLMSSTVGARFLTTTLIKRNAELIGNIGTVRWTTIATFATALIAAFSSTFAL